MRVISRRASSTLVPSVSHLVGSAKSRHRAVLFSNWYLIAPSNSLISPTDFREDLSQINSFILLKKVTGACSSREPAIRSEIRAPKELSLVGISSLPGTLSAISPSDSYALPPVGRRADNGTLYRTYF